MSILDEIAAYARLRVEADKKKTDPEKMKQLAIEAADAARPAGDADGAEADKNRSFRKAIARPGLSFICEVKKASPSKGLIDPIFDYRRIAAEYEAAGADCISCLTEPKWFLGSDEIFCKIREKAGIPMLRKDFVIDLLHML